MELEDFFKQRLEERKQNGTHRTLRPFDCVIDFYSNDYLSLSKYPSASIKPGSSPGSSRLIAGNTQEHERLETRLAKFFERESSLLFNSGYVANLGVLSSIPQKDDVIVYDELSHASIKDGVRLSLAKSYKFKHNDLNDLQRLLEAHKSLRCFVVTEGLFSMDGVYAKIGEIDAICKQFSAYLIVDEAHSGGTFGDEGKGICFSQGVQPFMTIYTLGKAFASLGAVVCCSEITRSFLINYARTFIYTTALPINAVNRSIQLFKSNEISTRTSRLSAVINNFNEYFSSFHFVSDPASPIKILRISDVQKLKQFENTCLSNGIGIKAIFPPTVPEGKSCLRISLHANHTKEDLASLHALFNQVLS